MDGGTQRDAVQPGGAVPVPARGGHALVVFGHTPTVAPLWSNNTVNIDTGWVFGGRLSALRYPEREIVSVPARKVYCDPGHRFGAASQPGGPAV